VGFPCRSVNIAGAALVASFALSQSSTVPKPIATQFPSTAVSSVPAAPSESPKPVAHSPTQPSVAVAPANPAAAKPSAPSFPHDSAAAPYGRSAFDYERKVPAYVEEHLVMFSKGKRTTSRTNFMEPTACSSPSAT